MEMYGMNQSTHCIDLASHCRCLSKTKKKQNQPPSNREMRYGWMRAACASLRVLTVRNSDSKQAATWHTDLLLGTSTTRTDVTDWPVSLSLPPSSCFVFFFYPETQTSRIAISRKKKTTFWKLLHNGGKIYNERIIIIECILIILFIPFLSSLCFLFFITDNQDFLWYADDGQDFSFQLTSQTPVDGVINFWNRTTVARTRGCCFPHDVNVI